MALARIPHLSRNTTMVVLAGALALSTGAAVGQAAPGSTSGQTVPPTARVPPGAASPSTPAGAPGPGTPSGARAADSGKPSGADSATSEAAAAERAEAARKAAEEDRAEADPPGPREGETLPEPPAANAQGAVPEEAEAPGGPPPASYLVPPPPAGAYYPGPIPTASGQTDTGEIKLPSRISTRLRVLSSDLDALANRGGPSLTNGVLSVVTGGLSIALGALLAEDSLSPFLYVFGGASMARGVVDLAFSPDPDAVALEFSHMPMRDVEEVKLRLRFGEQGLQGLADDSRIARILDGSLSIAAGVAVVPLVLLPLSEDDREVEALDVFVIIGAGISVLTGIVSLVNKSDAERRDEAYAKLKRRLSQPPAKKKRSAEAPQVSMTVAPSGAVIRLVQRF